MTTPKTTFCWNCWRDWKKEFLDLSPWEQEQFLAAYPRLNPNDFAEGKCPFCGARYDDEFGEWFLELIFDDDDDAPDSDYGRADWEDNPSVPGSDSG